MSARARSGGQAAAQLGAPALRPAALILRRAGATDLKPLEFFFDTLLRNDYFLRRGQLAEMLDDGYHEVYVAEIDAVLVGAAITTGGARLVNVLIHPAYRGIGLGSALLNFSRAWEVRVKTDVSAGDPRGFYRRAGFRSVARDAARPHIEIMRLPEGDTAKTKSTAKNGNGHANNGAGHNRNGNRNGRHR